MHNNVKVTKDAQTKPRVIAFCDRMKGGVDVMDMMAGFFQRNSRQGVGL